MPLILSAFATGLLFGLGLIVSQMVNPAKVIGFLDLFGNWDPSLAFVMGGAVAVSSIGFILAKRRGQPVLAARLELPTRRDYDPNLIIGSATFGAGWGLAGLCPGPALVGITFGSWHVAAFVVAMVAGMAAHSALFADRPQRFLKGKVGSADG